MNSSWNQGITLVLAILAVILEDRRATGLRCYECSTSWSDDCRMSPPPSKYLKTCSGQLTTVLKNLVPLCSKFYSEENGMVRVERYCGGSDFSNGCREASFSDRLPGARFIPAVTCRCGDQDGCNGGLTKLSMGTPLILMGSLAVMMMA